MKINKRNIKYKLIKFKNFFILIFAISFFSFTPILFLVSSKTQDKQNLAINDKIKKSKEEIMADKIIENLKPINFNWITFFSKNKLLDESIIRNKVLGIIKNIINEKTEINSETKIKIIIFINNNYLISFNNQLKTEIIIKKISNQNQIFKKINVPNKFLNKNDYNDKFKIISTNDDTLQKYQTINFEDQNKIIINKEMSFKQEPIEQVYLLLGVDNEKDKTFRIIIDNINNFYNTQDGHYTLEYIKNKIKNKNNFASAFEIFVPLKKRPEDNEKITIKNTPISNIKMELKWEKNKDNRTWNLLLIYNFFPKNQLFREDDTIYRFRTSSVSIEEEIENLKEILGVSLKGYASRNARNKNAREVASKIKSLSTFNNYSLKKINKKYKNLFTFSAKEKVNNVIVSISIKNSNNILNEKNFFEIIEYTIEGFQDNRNFQANKIVEKINLKINEKKTNKLKIINNNDKENINIVKKHLKDVDTFKKYSGIDLKDIFKDSDLVTFSSSIIDTNKLLVTIKVPNSTLDDLTYIIEGFSNNDKIQKSPTKKPTSKDIFIITSFSLLGTGMLFKLFLILNKVIRKKYKN